MDMHKHPPGWVSTGAWAPMKVSFGEAFGGVVRGRFSGAAFGGSFGVVFGRGGWTLVASPSSA